MLSKNKILFSLLLGQLLTSTQVFSMPSDSDEEETGVSTRRSATVRTPDNQMITAPQNPENVVRTRNQDLVVQEQERNRAYIAAQQREAFEYARTLGRIKSISFAIEGDEVSYREQEDSRRGSNTSHTDSTNTSNQRTHNTRGARETVRNTGGGISILGFGISGGHSQRDFHGPNSNGTNHNTRNETHSHTARQWNVTLTEKSATLKKGKFSWKVKFWDTPSMNNDNKQPSNREFPQFGGHVLGGGDSRSSRLLQSSNQTSPYITDEQREIEIAKELSLLSFNNTQKNNSTSFSPSEERVLGGNKPGVQLSSKKKSSLTEEEQIQIAIMNSYMRK